MKLIAFLLLALWATNSRAQTQVCEPMTKAQADAVLPRLKEAFTRAHRLSMDTIAISPGTDCGDEISFVFKAKPEAANFGSRWIIKMKKGNHKIDIQEGV
ncbi:hypothetical protein FHW69_001723 [Luteibacter sp. Sphag1AF]|uniref:hypothetical protein n=1 Tax=Luteibacter sp. Sphag1AF TaxID=2587031 RepID=UPI00161919B6|nr:hypothetical protein [Luteibacter sp. Sphag1AF]MBB3227122.1 hypothetical protein [Luteibacter sp. Sphag1AF]